MPFIWHLGGEVCSFRGGANSFSAVIFTLFTDWSSENIPNECEKTQFLKDLVNDKENRINSPMYIRKLIHCACACVCVCVCVLYTLLAIQDECYNSIYLIY